MVENISSADVHAADGSQDQKSETPSNFASSSLECGKRSISPIHCHPSAKQPRIMEPNRINKHSQLYAEESAYDQLISRKRIENITETCNKSFLEKNLDYSQSLRNEGRTLTDSTNKGTKYKELCIKLEDFQKNRRRDQKKSKCEHVYEVEKFLGKKSENDIIFYLIKWKNWSAEFSTWEPVHNLTNCAELLKEFEEGRLRSLDKFQKHTNFYPNSVTIEKHMQDILSSGNIIDSSLANTDRLYEKINEFFSANPIRKKQLINNIKEHILHMLVYNTRAEQLASLSEWENEMNSITAGKPLIKVENLVDLERAPQEFLYIDDYLPGSNVIIPEEPPIGCECSTCDSKSRCCYAMCDGNFPYTSACRIRVPPGTPIYECNKRCTCSDKCPNRVVQRGSQMKLCVFRTNNGRGWGVKTLRIIKKGTFVIQYVGEVITNEEAERRGKEYDAAGRTYLFDLDYNETEEQCPYTVDAAIYGNISHFINHSCDPNLAVYAVWINCLDPNLPKLALFATRDIKQNEEITFDYTCQTNKDDLFRCRMGLNEKSSNERTIDSRIRCKCGASNCREYLF